MCNRSNNEDCNSSNYESIIGNKCKPFSRPINSSSDSDSGTSDNNEKEYMRLMRCHRRIV